MSELPYRLPQLSVSDVPALKVTASKAQDLTSPSESAVLPDMQIDEVDRFLQRLFEIVGAANGANVVNAAIQDCCDSVGFGPVLNALMIYATMSTEQT